MPLLSITGLVAFLRTAIFAFGYISNNALFPEPLSPEEEAMYLEKYMEGDEEARNILIERNLRLVAHICKKYNIPNVDNDDLISIGTIGLIKGINTFNTNKISEEKILGIINKVFDFSVKNIISELDLKHLDYTKTTCFGHFGKNNLSYEKLNKVDLIKSMI